MKGTNSVSCCVPKFAGDAVINLDVHEEVLETLPLTKSTRVLPQHFHHYHSENNLFCLQGQLKLTFILINLFKLSIPFTFQPESRVVKICDGLEECK